MTHLIFLLQVAASAGGLIKGAEYLLSADVGFQLVDAVLFS